MILYPPNIYVFSCPSVLVLDSLKSVSLFCKATVVWEFHLYGLHFSALWKQVILTFRVPGKTGVYDRIGWNSKCSDKLYIMFSAVPESHVLLLFPCKGLVGF